MNDFAYREAPRLGRRLFRLGLSGSFGLDEAGCREVLKRIQYVFWYPRMKGLTPALRKALARDRERYAVSTGPLFGYFPGAVRRTAVIAYTATAWRRLLRASRGWKGRVPPSGRL